MPKTKTPAQAAEDEKRAAKRKNRRIENEQSADAELDEALDDSFPASDPPSMTQPRTEVGAPSRGRKRDR